MTMKLCLTATFLDSLYHGQGDYGPEWPPSPFRLFQALLAGAARNGHTPGDEFRWLESLEAPRVQSPRTEDACDYKTFVPNNDTDKVLLHRIAPPAHNCLTEQKNRTEKRIRPTRLLGDDRAENRTVHYLWDIRPEDEPLARRIAEHARCVSALGWGIDLVACDGRILTAEEADAIPGVRWSPNRHGDNSLRCPCEGTLGDLRAVYESFLNRIDGKVYRPARRPSVFRIVRYVSDSTAIRPVACFELRRIDEPERMASFDQRKTAHVAAWARHVACEAGKKADANLFPGGSEVYVAGHTNTGGVPGRTPPRFSYLPLPTVGHPNADGRVRRFIIAEPLGGDGHYAEWAEQRLHGAVLKTKDAGPQAILVRSTERDGVFGHYLAAATSFVSVTPVILPGYDDRRYAKTEQLLFKAMTHAGLPPEEWVDALDLQKAPLVPAAFHPQEYGPMPAYLKSLSRIHVRLRLKKDLPGPISLGAGRHLGLGSFIRSEE